MGWYMIRLGGIDMENNIVFTDKEAFIVVSFYGEINSFNAPGYRKELSHLIENSQKDIVFDFKHTSFIDSSGIGLVLGRYNQLKNNHRMLLLSGLSTTCFRVFELTGLFLIMPYFNSIEDIREGVI